MNGISFMRSFMMFYFCLTINMLDWLFPIFGTILLYFTRNEKIRLHYKINTIELSLLAIRDCFLLFFNDSACSWQGASICPHKHEAPPLVARDRASRVISHLSAPFVCNPPFIACSLKHFRSGLSISDLLFLRIPLSPLPTSPLLCSIFYVFLHRQL